MLRILYFLLFPVLLVYPNGLLADTYLNYLYVVFVFICFILFDKKYAFKFLIVNRFFLWLFYIVLVANICSTLLTLKVGAFDYLSSTFRYLNYFLISSILVSTTQNANDLRFWMKSFLFGFILSLLILFLDSFRIPWIEPIFKIDSFEEKNTLDIYFRAFGAYLSPISAGVFLLNSFLLFMTILVTKVLAQRNLKIILWILSFLSVIGVIMTASRTSLVALGLVSLLLFLYSGIKLKYIFFLAIFCIVIYKVGFLDVYFDNIILRNENEATVGQGILEGSGRTDTFENSIKLFYDERTFFFGVGPSEYSLGDGVHSMAHNGFLSLLFCYGLFGVILFILTIVKLIKISNLRKLKLINPESSKFLRPYLFLFIVTNSITFISSDGPVTHFWLIFLILFLYFFENFIKYKNFSFGK